MWQKCPICNGTGIIPNEFNNSSAWSPFITCTVCNGFRIISKITGLPPVTQNILTKLESIELSNLKNP